MQDRGLAAYIAELIGTLFLVFVIGVVVTLFVADQRHVADRIGLRGRRPRARVRALPADHRLRAGERRALQPGRSPSPRRSMRRIDPIDAVVYILAQLSGGVLGALLVKAILLDEGRRRQLRRRGDQSDLISGPFAAACVEALGTFLLVLAVCAVALNPRARQEWAPLAIGTTLGFAVMIFGPLTGGSFNPARWFGPALIGDAFNGFSDSWPYVIGPIVGALVAVLVYRFVIAGPQYAEGAEPPTSDVRGGRPGGQGRRDACAKRNRRRGVASVWTRAARHLLAQLHALALANLPVLLQVLRVRDSSARTSTRLRRSSSASTRRCGATPRSCSCSPARLPEVNPEVAARLALLRPRGLRLLRRLGLRAGARARAAAAHQPRRPRPRRSRPPARGDRLAGADARVDQPRPRRPPGLADQAPASDAWRRSAPPASCGSRSRAGSWSGSARPRTSASRRSRRSPRSHAEHGHIQEVILQNFVPHPRYYGREVAEIADAAAQRRAGAATSSPQSAEQPMPGVGHRRSRSTR